MARTPNFVMVIEVFAKPGEELLVGTDSPIETEAGDPPGETTKPVEPGGPKRARQRLRMNAQDLRRQAEERSPELFENICLLIEASYLGVVSNQRPWGM